MPPPGPGAGTLLAPLNDEASAQRRAPRTLTSPAGRWKGTSMLVLSRKLKEKLLLPAIGTAVQVLEIKRGVVRLGIEAPPEVAVLREEVANPLAAGGPGQGRRGDRPTARADDHLARRLCDRLQTTGAGPATNLCTTRKGLLVTPPPWNLEPPGSGRRRRHPVRCPWTVRRRRRRRAALPPGRGAARPGRTAFGTTGPRPPGPGPGRTRRAGAHSRRRS